MKTLINNLIKIRTNKILIICHDMRNTETLLNKVDQKIVHTKADETEQDNFNANLEDD